MSRNNVDRIYDTVKKINRVYETWSDLHGLTLYEMQMFYVIWRRESRCITQKELCQELDAPKTSVNSIIKRQLQAGWIVMEVNPRNKREKVISLTEAGEAFTKRLIDPLLAYEEEAAAQMNDEEAEIAVRVQNRFADYLLERIGQENGSGTEE